MASLARANPFFQEFQVIFKDPALGMVVQNVNNLPTVKQILQESTAEDENAVQYAAERGGVTAGCVISGVNREESLGLRAGYKEVVRKIKRYGRPVTLTFRRLHAVEDPDLPRRYWQGYLRTKCGPQSWTGRFYVLREDGCLLSYPGKDIMGQEPLECIENVHLGSVMQGEALRRAAETALAVQRDEELEQNSYQPLSSSQDMYMDLMLESLAAATNMVLKGASNPNDATLWTTIFAICMPNNKDVFLFRAESAKAKMDWICAITTLVVAKDLRMEMEGQGRGPETVANPTHAVGSRTSSALVLKQGYLKHRKQRQTTSNKNQTYLAPTWKQRWFVVQDNGRLLWYRSLPSDVSELPSGSIDLRQSELCTDPNEIGRYLKHKNEQEELQEGFTIMVVPLQTDSKGMYLPPIILKTLSQQDRAEWVNCMMAATTGAMDAVPFISEDAQTARTTALRSIQEEPSILFRSPEVAFALMIGSQSGRGILKENFVSCAGQYFIPLCDAFTADLVFNNLVSQYEAIKKKYAMSSKDRLISVGDKLGEWGSISDLVSDWAEGYFSGIPVQTETKTRTVTSEPLVEGVQMTYTLFWRYTQNFQDCTQTVEPWAELRVRLNLDPHEVLVKWEDFVSDSEQLGGMLTNSGRLFLTDRHAFLHKSFSDQVLVVPLSSVQEVRPSSRQAGFSREEDVVELVGCHVHSILLNSEGKGKDESRLSFDEEMEDVNSGEGVTVKLVFSKMLDMFGKPAQKRQGRRNIWFYMLREMVEAHKLALELQHFDTSSPSFLSTIGSKIADIQSGWSDKLESNRLPLWAATNLIRSRAISRTTERFTTVLMICSHQQNESNQRRLWNFLHDHSLHAKQKGEDNCQRSPQKLSSQRKKSPKPQSRISQSPTQTTHKTGNSNVDEEESTDMFTMNNPRWFQILVHFLARTEDYTKKQHHFNAEFNPAKFKDEWGLFWDFFDRTVLYWQSCCEDLFDWKDPLLSAFVFALALAVAWHDILEYSLSLVLVGNVCYILVAGSQSQVQRQEKRAKQRLREEFLYYRNETSLDPGGHTRLSETSTGEAKVEDEEQSDDDMDYFNPSSEDDSSDGKEMPSKELPQCQGTPPRPRSPSQSLSTLRSRSPSVTLRSDTSNSMPVEAASRLRFWARRALVHSSKIHSMKSLKVDSISGAIGNKVTNALSAQKYTPISEPEKHSKEKHKTSEDQGILNLIHTIKSKLGEVQENIHNYNTFWLKFRSLYSWVDISRTKIYILLLLSFALYFALVPFRYTYCGAVIFLFTKPLRDDKPPLPVVLLQHFANGIPVESNTHTNLQMASIYKSENIKRQIALRKRLLKVSHEKKVL